MDDEIKACYEKAGRIAAKALAHGASLIKPNAKVRDVLDAVETFILEEGAGIAFPAQASINEVAAHYCPTRDDDQTFQPTDLVKLDVGVHVDGYVGDNALTVNLDSENEEKNLLVEASRAARDAAIALVKPGVTLHELGKAIEAEITSAGFQPIHNLSGHGLGRYQIHTAPSIPNYGNNDPTTLEEGMVVAIEPFATTGKGRVKNGSPPTLYAQVAKKGVRSSQAREVLQTIETYNGLPFTTRWLEREHGSGKARLAIRQLILAGVLHEYPPLPEEAGGIVSQSEHTLLVTKNGCQILTQVE